MPSNSYRLGDQAATLLAGMGFTHERLSRWLGRDCGCGNRQARLNAFGHWLATALRRPTGRGPDMKGHLERMMEEQ